MRLRSLYRLQLDTFQNNRNKGQNYESIVTQLYKIDVYKYTCACGIYTLCELFTKII